MNNLNFLNNREYTFNDLKAKLATIIDANDDEYLHKRITYVKNDNPLCVLDFDKVNEKLLNESFEFPKDGDKNDEHYFYFKKYHNLSNEELLFKLEKNSYKELLDLANDFIFVKNRFYRDAIIAYILIKLLKR